MLNTTSDTFGAHNTFSKQGNREQGIREHYISVHTHTHIYISSY